MIGKGNDSKCILIPGRDSREQINVEHAFEEMNSHMLDCPVIFQSWFYLPPEGQGIKMQAVDIKELHRKG